MAQPAVAYYSMTGSSGRRDVREQGESIAEFVRRRRWVLVEPYVEVEGRHRPHLQQALARCQELSAILVVPSMATAGRDRVFLDAVLEARVRVAAPDRPRVGRSTLELLREVARERSARVSERSREALRRARLRGVRIGSPRPEVGAARAGAVLRAQADSRARSLAPLLQEIQLSNPDISLRGIAQLLNEQGVATPRGGRWGPSTVKSALERNRAS
jgi:DNA invertase Pin-like site-specific DNA recombinase